MIKIIVSFFVGAGTGFFLCCLMTASKIQSVYEDCYRILKGKEKNV